MVSGHAELGSLIMNGRDLGLLTANISSTATETRVDNGRLLQANGGGAQFALVIPRTGENNTSIDATLDRLSGSTLAALPFFQARLVPPELGGPTKLEIQSDISGRISISGFPDAMSGVADIRMGPGKVQGEALQSLTAHATFAGSSVTVDSVDANFDAGHIVGSGKYDTKTKAFDVKFSGDRVQLERLTAFA